MHLVIGIQINNYLKAVLVGAIQIEQVKLWIDRVRDWDENIAVIKYRIDNNILLYEAYQDILPEGYYPSEMIKYEVEQTGKSYDEICKIFVTQIEAQIEISKKLKDYINESKVVTKIALSKMESRFRSLLQKETTTSTGSKLSNQKSENNTTESDNKGTSRKLPAFESSPSKENKISEIYKKLISGNSPFINTTEKEFKQLFSGPKYPDVKVNWKRARNELHRFIDKLYDNGIVDEGDIKKWEKTACYFTLRGLTISPADLKGAYRFTNKAKIKEIDLLFT